MCSQFGSRYVTSYNLMIAIPLKHVPMQRKVVKCTAGGRAVQAGSGAGAMELSRHEYGLSFASSCSLKVTSHHVGMISDAFSV